MRTKALLCAAAVAAGALTSMAQSNVYSLNIVGYVNTPMVTGYNLLGNPLDNGTNDLASLFPNASFGDTVYTFVGGSFQSAVYFGSWSPDAVLAPGLGFFYNAGAPGTNTFVGNVLTGTQTVNIPAGYSMVASKIPIAATLGNLNFPANFGDTVYYYGAGGFSSSVFFGSWSPDNTVGVGQGFWINAGAAEVWTQVFNP